MDFVFDFLTFAGVAIFIDWATGYLTKWADSNAIWSAVIGWSVSALSVTILVCAGIFEAFGVFTGWESDFYWWMMTIATFACGGLLATGRISIDAVKSWLAWLSNIPKKQ